jgi:hypothetical protein
LAAGKRHRQRVPPGLCHLCTGAPIVSSWHRPGRSAVFHRRSRSRNDGSRTAVQPADVGARGDDARGVLGRRPWAAGAKAPPCIPLGAPTESS